jgi:hypothetical protein
MGVVGMDGMGVEWVWVGWGLSRYGVEWVWVG